LAALLFNIIMGKLELILFFLFNAGIISLSAASSSMDNYDVKFYWLDIEASDTTTFISGSVTILVEITGSPSDELTFELVNDYTVDSVLAGGEKAEFIHQDDELVVGTGKEYTIATLVSIQIFYSGSADAADANPGIYNKPSYQLGRNVTFTLSEPYYSKKWFPCKQVITDKADSVYVFVTTESGLKAGSNGILASTVALPGNKVRYEWKSRYPIAYYLISIAVADYYDYSFYMDINGSEDSLLIQNYIYNTTGFLEENKVTIDKTENLINLFSEKYGPYPFREEKYGHCIAPMGGGMEHQTMTTLGFFSFDLVAHELSHQWFGDNVTCATWQDIWINEGFASYSEYIANEYLISPDKANLWMYDAHEHVKTESGGSIYIPASDIDNYRRIFDNRLSYKKGAAIIHMIRHELQNDTLFFEVLREFQSSYSDSVATGLDFKLLLEEKTGRDFTDFFNQWYFGEGFPMLSVNWNYANDTLTINTLQTTSSALTPLFNALVEYRISTDRGDTTIFIRQQSNYEQYKIYMNRKVTDLKADPDRWLLMDIDVRDHLDQENKYVITPNTVRSRLIIEFKRPVEEYRIYITDTSGRIIENFESNSQYYLLDVNSLSRGLYFIMIKENGNFYSSKFIKM
jgi:aminopeptidase N